ncbi:MAG: HAMP domain-containing histidine kinase [Bacteroidales bacterium]|nr:HAMP domain-containing histidine kinase [Bacteroidales bacterium]
MTFIPIWNTVVRLFIFLIVGLLLYSFREEHKKLFEANQKLKLFNEEKNKFIGIAAHDLRSPLAGIYSFTDLLLNDPKKGISPDVSEIISLIRKMSNNGMIMIKDLLDISKIESGNIDLKMQQNDYITFLKEQIRINQLLAKNKEISIILEHQADKIFACFDRNYLAEVIDNLLTNAIKYSFINSNIIVRVTESENKIILTEVIDSGKGIQVDEQQNLFNYFQKTSTKPTAGEQSTGLGLAIAKKIVTAHKGSIGVKSKTGEGSVFYFTLPLNC